MTTADRTVVRHLSEKLESAKQENVELREQVQALKEEAAKLSLLLAIWRDGSREPY